MFALLKKNGEDFVQTTCWSQKKKSSIHLTGSQPFIYEKKKITDENVN